MTSRPGFGTLAGFALVALAATGCGLKGPLTLPEPSESVVIRGPGQPAEPAASEATAPAGAAPPAEGAAPATAPTTTTVPAKPKADRPPPPPLPGGNPGTARGG